MHHAGAVGPAFDTLNPYSWQPEQQRVPSDTALGPFVRLNASQHSDFGRPRASSWNDTPHESEITTAPLNLKSRVTAKVGDQITVGQSFTQLGNTGHTLRPAVAAAFRR
jgi:hypothetical protein